MAVTAEVDLAYIAGLLDGEGCVTLSKKHVVIEITNTNRKVLDWCVRVLGFGKVYEKGGTNCPSYTLAFNSKDGQTLLLALWPYIKIKSEQVKILFSFWKIVEYYGTNTKSSERKVMILDLRSRIQKLNTYGKGGHCGS